ncbi:MAG: hypothetical protein RLZZ226_1911 [Pseudomonadota bacterium]|jgi:hypothetical protein
MILNKPRRTPESTGRHVGQFTEKGGKSRRTGIADCRINPGYVHPRFSATGNRLSSDIHPVASKHRYPRTAMEKRGQTAFIGGSTMLSRSRV